MAATGVRWTVDKRDAVKQLVHRAAAAGLGEAAEFVLEESNRTAPIEEGTMIRSGATDLDEAKLQASVFYDTPYAARQHEDMGLQHDPGRRAKWLESTVKENGQQVVDHVVGKVKAALR